MSPFELLYGVKTRLGTTDESMSERSSPLEDLFLEILSIKSSRFSHIHKMEWHGGLVDEKKVTRFNVGDIVLVVHGSVVGSRVKGPKFKSIYYGTCRVNRENHPVLF